MFFYMSMMGCDILNIEKRRNAHITMKGCFLDGKEKRIKNAYLPQIGVYCTSWFIIRGKKTPTSKVGDELPHNKKWQRFS